MLTAVAQHVAEEVVEEECQPPVGKGHEDEDMLTVVAHDVAEEVVEEECQAPVGKGYEDEDRHAVMEVVEEDDAHYYGDDGDWVSETQSPTTPSSEGALKKRRISSPNGGAGHSATWGSAGSASVVLESEEASAGDVLADGFNCIAGGKVSGTSNWIIIRFTLSIIAFIIQHNIYVSAHLVIVPQ
jgi:hypothetical protein